MRERGAGRPSSSWQGAGHAGLRAHGICERPSCRRKGLPRPFVKLALAPLERRSGQGLSRRAGAHRNCEIGCLLDFHFDFDCEPRGERRLPSECVRRARRRPHYARPWEGSRLVGSLARSPARQLALGCLLPGAAHFSTRLEFTLPSSSL